MAAPMFPMRVVPTGAALDAVVEQIDLNRKLSADEIVAIARVVGPLGAAGPALHGRVC